MATPQVHALRGQGLAYEIRRRIEWVYADGAVKGDDGRDYEVLPDSVTPERGRFLADLCARAGAATTLEVGMAWGLSTLCLLEALVERPTRPRHVVMDPFQGSRYRNAGLRLVREAGAMAFVEFHEEPSCLVLPRLLAEGQAFDLALVDGSHFFDDTFLELFYIHRLLRPGGLLVVDDTWIEAVRLVCQFAEAVYGYEFADAVAAPAGPRRRRFRRPKLTRPLISAYRKPVQPPPARHWSEMVRFYEDRWRRRVPARAPS